MTRNGPGLPMDCCSSRTGPRLWIISVGVLLLLPVTAAHQTGSRNVDCGSTINYRDAKGIEWEPDDEYLSTGLGTNEKVTVPQNQVENRQQLSTARYFQPDRKRFCYIFPNVTYNGSYLLRASFLYGDLATPLTTGCSFNLAIDSSIVGEIDIRADNMNSSVTLKYFVAARSEEMAFCLLPLKGGPFISSLELRPLESQMYAGYMFLSQYGVLTQRLNCGANITDPAIRFPIDEFDRIWETPNSSYSFNTFSTDDRLDLAELFLLDYAPLEVMQSAWQSDLGLSFTINLGQNQKYYASLFFAEIRSLNATDLTVIDIFLNGEEWYTNITLDSDNSFEIYKIRETSTASAMNFTILADPVSTLPPLLNAFEIHTIHDANITTTASSDRQVLDDLRQSFGLTDWTGDPCFPIPWDWLTCTSDDPAMVTQIELSKYELQGTIPASIGGLAALTDLGLENNFIRGSIPDLSNLTKLQTLHLQNNSLTGAIPDSLANLPLLTELFLQNNILNGTVPAALVNKNGLTWKVDSFNLPGASPQSKSGSNGVSIGPIIGAVVGVAAFVLLLGALLYCLRKRRRSATSQQYPTKTSDQKDAHTVDKGGSVQSTKAFSLAEVHKITNNLKERIGEGGFGPVYFGKLDNGTEVAVKVNSETSGQGRTEFSTEVSLLSRIHHRNLVHLIGFCDESNKKILIYEFMKDGTLREHLYGKGQRSALDWPARLQIAVDAARGLEYLHYDCHPRIIHRDVKSNNILLNENLQAKVTDFGISKSHEEDTTADFSTVVKGTRGYLDPEYYTTTKLTYKSDVYAFGVVLLEIISGRAPIDTKLADHGQWGLVDYARQMLSESKLEIIADRSLGENYNKEAMWKVAELAMRCVEPRSVNRPDMREVVKELVEATQYDQGMDPVSSSYITTTSESGNDDTTRTFTRNFESRFFPTKPKPEFPYHPSHQKPNPATATATATAIPSNRREVRESTATTAPWNPPAPR